MNEIPTQVHIAIMEIGERLKREPKPGLLENLRYAMSLAREHWMCTIEDHQFRLIRVLTDGADPRGTTTLRTEAVQDLLAERDELLALVKERHMPGLTDNCDSPECNNWDCRAARAIQKAEGTK